MKTSRKAGFFMPNFFLGTNQMIYLLFEISPKNKLKMRSKFNLRPQFHMLENAELENYMNWL
jgi:hypothetical protein